MRRISLAPKGRAELLEPELAEALDVDMLPLAYYGLKKGLDAAEANLAAGGSVASVPVLGPLFAGYEYIKEAYNTALDVADTGLFVADVASALLRSNEATKGGTLANMMPEKPMGRLEMRKLKGLTDVLTNDPTVKALIEKQRVNVLEVVSKAYFKHIVWGTTGAQMLGEIAGVLIAGRGAGNAGAATAQGAVDAARLAVDLTEKYAQYLPIIA